MFFYLVSDSLDWLGLFGGLYDVAGSRMNAMVSSAVLFCHILVNVESDAREDLLNMVC